MLAAVPGAGGRGEMALAGLMRAGTRMEAVKSPCWVPEVARGGHAGARAFPARGHAGPAVSCNPASSRPAGDVHTRSRRGSTGPSVWAQEGIQTLPLGAEPCRRVTGAASAQLRASWAGAGAAPPGPLAALHPSVTDAATSTRKTVRMDEDVGRGIPWPRPTKVHELLHCHRHILQDVGGRVMGLPTRSLSAPRGEGSLRLQHSRARGSLSLTTSIAPPQKKKQENPNIVCSEMEMCGNVFGGDWSREFVEDFTKSLLHKKKNYR